MASPDRRPVTGSGADGRALPGPAIVVSLLTAVHRTGVWIPDRLLLRSLDREITTTYDDQQGAYLLRIADTVTGLDRLLLPEGW